MKKDEPNDQVRLAATNALFNSLEFTKANFDREGERHFIMQVVCEATQSNSEGVREKALQCLVRIMQLYYQYMDLYMAQALFAVCSGQARLRIGQQKNILFVFFFCKM